jgi:hypothetical protein
VKIHAHHRTRRTAAAAIACCGLAFVAGRSLSQPPPEAKVEAPAPVTSEPPVMPGVEQIAARLAEESAPAEEHKVLEALAGSFKTVSRMYPDPTEPPLISQGTSTAEWILGKRFLKVETKVGEEKELKGESLTIYGFDTRTRKYTVLGLDTFGTYWVSAEGEYDAAGRELKLAGTVEEYGQKIRFKWNLKIEDEKNTQTVMLHIQGDEWMKAAEVVNSKR